MSIVSTDVLYIHMLPLLNHCSCLADSCDDFAVQVPVSAKLTQSSRNSLCRSTTRRQTDEPTVFSVVLDGPSELQTERTRLTRVLGEELATFLGVRHLVVASTSSSRHRHMSREVRSELERFHSESDTGRVWCFAVCP